jgi:hypothetical protein
MGDPVAEDDDALHVTEVPVTAQVTCVRLTVAPSPGSNVGPSSAAAPLEQASTATVARAGARLRTEPVLQLGARLRNTVAGELRAQLADRAAALGEHVVVVDRLQVHLS